MNMQSTRRAARFAVALALLAVPAGALDAPALQDIGPPDFGVLQFTEDEAFVDLPVPLAEAWKQTLEVVASLNGAVSADLPYLESNGRIVAGDLWIAVESAGVPGQSWVRIRVAIPAAEPEYGKVRAEILLDAIADRLEPPAPPANEFSYPLPPVAEGVVTNEYVTNNYYYESSPAVPYYGVYTPAVWSPYWYGSFYTPYCDPWGWSPYAWNCGWYYGWGGPWCNPWGSSFSLCFGSGWGWSLSACWGSVCGSWNNWDCDDDDWDCNGWDKDGNDTIVFGDGTVIVGADGDVLSLGPRTTGIGKLPNGDFATASTLSARRRNVAADLAAGQVDDRLPRVTDRASRRAPEASRPVVVTRSDRSSRTPRGVVVSGSGPADGRRPLVVRTGDDRTASPTDSGRSGSPTVSQTSPSRSSRKDGPRVVKLGSAPYSARVNPVQARSTSVSTPSSGGVVYGGGDASGGRSAGSSTTSHPYSNPFPTSSPAPSMPSAPRASAPPVSSPRPSMPAASPPRASTPSRAPSASAPSSGGSRSSGGSSGGSRSSGGSSGGGRSSGGSSGGRGPR